jgi:two-component system sensor histidine kinase DegS
MLFSETLVALLQKYRVEEALQAVAQIQESGHRALKEIRLMLYRAQSTLVDQNVDMVAALEDRLNMVERRAGVSVNLIGADEAGAYCPALFKEDLYGIIMEALNNSLKYSHSKSVEVCFNHNDGYLSVSVTDDGAGFDPERKRAGGFGMRSMRERAELIGGHLVITSAPGNGTRVFINIKME